MGMAEEKYDEKRGLYYDHSMIYKKEPDPFDEYDHSTIYKKEPDPLDEINPDPFQRPANIATGDYWHLIGPTHRWKPTVGPDRYPPPLIPVGPFEFFDEGAPKEKVNHPQHYNQGKIEVIDAIDDWDLDFCEGNIVKYVTRSRHKGNRLQDLEKAKWYLDHLVERARLADNQNLADNQPPCPDKRNA